MTRPMRYHTVQDKERMIKGGSKVVRKSKTDKNKENMIE